MNKKILLLSTALMLPLTGFAASGEEAHHCWHEHKVERLSKELSLSDDQKTKLEAIFKEQHEKFRAFHEESNNRVKEVLTPEQVTKWEALKQQHHGKHHKKPQETPVTNP